MLVRILKKLFLISLPTILILFLLCEFVLFRYVLPASEWPYRSSITGPNDVVRYVWKNTGMYSHGTFRQGFPEEIKTYYQINPEGWNSLRNYEEKKHRTRIAVIGDSFVDCLQVGNEDCFPSVMEKLLNSKHGKDVEVYKFGFSGAPLSQYLHMARYVRKKFDPDVLVINLVANDFIDSIAGYDNEDGDYLQFEKDGLRWIEKKPSPYIPNPTRLWLKQSRTFRYFYGNLTLKFEWEPGNFLFKKKGPQEFRMNVPLKEVLSKEADIASLMRHVMKELISLSGRDVPLLILMDADREAIHAGKDPTKEESYRLIRMVQDVTAEFSVPCVSLTGIFESDYRKNRQLLNYPNDFHWNPRAHHLVAEAGSEFLARQVL